MLLYLILICNFFLPNATVQETASTEKVIVKLEVQGLRNEKGNIAIGLFSKEKGFDSKNIATYRELLAPITQNKAFLLIDDIPPGEYMFAILHDENENHRADFNWIGIPTEGVGFSQNPSLMWGAPNFEDCSFVAKSGETIQIVKIKYLL